MPPIWPMTVGIAVAMTDVSRATRKVATNSARVISRRSAIRPVQGIRLVASPSPSGRGLGRGGRKGRLRGGGGARKTGELGEPDADQRAVAFALAAGPDAAVVLLDDVAADIQPQAHASDLPHLRL